MTVNNKKVSVVFTACCTAIDNLYRGEQKFFVRIRSGLLSILIYNIPMEIQTTAKIASPSGTQVLSRTRS